MDLIKRAESFTQKVPAESEVKTYLENASALNGIVKMLENILGDEKFLETQECTNFISSAEEQILSII